MNYLIEIAAYVCECVTLLLCIHSFLGKKIKLDYKTVLLVVADVTTLMVILNFNLPGVCTFIVQIYFFIFAWWKFNISIMQNIVLLILDILLITAVQSVATIPTYVIAYMLGVEDLRIIGLIINLVSMIMAIMVLRFMKLNKLYIKLTEPDKIIIEVLLVSLGLFLYLMIKYRVDKALDVWAYFASGIMASIVIVVVFYWQKEKYENKKKTLELHMQKLYGDAFEGMVDNIRLRQHDFKNQLAAIYGMHLTSNSFEDLVERQREYCDRLISESRYDSILTKCSDKILAGFLYTKLSEVAKKGIQIEFDILAGELNYSLEIYEIIEVIGILIDNAIEYETEKAKMIYFQLKEKEDTLCILYRNTVEYIPIETIHKFFDKGFSTKGEGRGLGLFNIKRIMDGRGEIMVKNRTIEDNNWLEFQIDINVKN